MQKEIGSTYWLEPNELDDLPKKSVKSPNLHASHRYVSTCRSAIGIVLDNLQIDNRVALLPAFTCESVLVSFLDRGYKVFPYPIRKDLSINWNAFNNAVDSLKPSVVLVHSYFGFDTIGELRPHVLELRNKCIFVIEDQTQTMFSNNALSRANYYVGSIRKWMPIPDGAFVTAPCCCEKEDTELVENKVKALIGKGNWITNGIGEKADFQNDFKIAEGILDSRKKPYSMSSLSREIFARTDMVGMKAKRRDNCQTLMSSMLANKALLDNLLLPVQSIGKDECPFHLPVLVKEGRRELQHYLAENNIFATVIWGCPDEYQELIDEESRYVYEHILCFHVDQRYDESDMNRIINVLNAYYNK